MSYENLACKILDLLTTQVIKYKDNENTRYLYNEVYDPIFAKLQPYFKHYCETEKLKLVLNECRNLLKSNHNLINPVYIARIDNIIDENGEFKHITNLSKKDRRKYNKSNEEGKKRIEIKRRNEYFNFFAHDFINDCNKLRKTLGVPYFTYAQKAYLDEITYKDMLSLAKTILVSSIILGVFLIFVTIIRFLALFFN